MFMDSTIQFMCFGITADMYKHTHMTSCTKAIIKISRNQVYTYVHTKFLTLGIYVSSVMPKSECVFVTV